jgi:hypothetical protein
MGVVHERIVCSKGLFALPPWQLPLWDSRPLQEGLFDRLSASDVDRGFLMGMVRNGVLLVPDLQAVQPFAVPNYSSALGSRGAGVRGGC